MNYEIIIESTCDLNAELRNKYHIYKEAIRGLVYIPGKEDMYADLEFKNYSPEEFFKLVKANAGKVHTAFGPYEEFARVVEPVLKEGKDAIVITISTGVSGTYNGFLNWANIMLEDYPERKITIIDSLRYSSASGLLAIYAAQNRDNGMSYEENVAWLNQYRHHIHEAGPMDDLSFLARNGRISATKAFFGKLAGVQPFADFTRDGKSAPLGTFKGEKKVNDASLQYVLKMATDLDNQIVIISHSARKERAELFKEQLLKVAHPKEVIITSVGESTGPNVGPGLCAYFFMGEAIQEGREKEIKVYESLK